MESYLIALNRDLKIFFLLLLIIGITSFYITLKSYYDDDKLQNEYLNGSAMYVIIGLLFLIILPSQEALLEMLK